MRQLELDTEQQLGRRVVSYSTFRSDCRPATSGTVSYRLIED